MSRLSTRRHDPAEAPEERAPSICASRMATSSTATTMARRGKTSLPLPISRAQTVKTALRRRSEQTGTGISATRIPGSRRGVRPARRAQTVKTAQTVQMAQTGTRPLSRRPSPERLQRSRQTEKLSLRSTTGLTEQTERMVLRARMVQMAHPVRMAHPARMA